MAYIDIPKNYQDNVDRALHDLYCERTTTLHPMLHIPIYARRMFKGDSFNFGISEAVLQSQATFAPLFGNWRLRFEWYFDSDCNRYGWMDNNTRLTADEIMNRRHHTVSLSNYAVIHVTEVPSPEVNTFWGIGKSSIWDYAGIAPGTVHSIEEDISMNSESRSRYLNSLYGNVINLDFVLTYLNIIRNYHVNRQFPDVPYVYSNGDPNGDTMVYEYNTFSCKDMDDLFMMLRQCDNGVHFDCSDRKLVDLTENDTIPAYLIDRYRTTINNFKRWLTSSTNLSFGGLFCSQYEPDLFQNLLSKDQQLKRSKVGVSSDGIYIDEFRLQNHLQHLYDLIYVSGGTDKALSRSRWGIKSNRQYDIPELICVNTEIIGTNLITSNNPGSIDLPDGTTIKSAPGSLAGNINTRRRGRGSQKFTASSSGMLMCIVSLVPIVSYSENIQRYLLENNFEDEFSPQMARKGFENVPLTDYCSLPTIYRDFEENKWYVGDPYINMDDVVGKQVAWLREMTDTNRVFGEFSNGGDMSDWVLRRRFMKLDSENQAFIDISPYGYPTDWQYPFVSQTITDPNFYLQVGIINRAYRPIGRRFMPTLGM